MFGVQIFGNKFETNQQKHVSKPKEEELQKFLLAKLSENKGMNGEEQGGQSQ